ncbi:molecular chaperone TorD family protein [Hoeflea sp. AS60]|uniref:TorD/DmsD family molecular chaperone n=1 Tax=Hoeflea sp. AS60 TaxID=3135780 RepID=UPI00316B4668
MQLIFQLMSVSVPRIAIAMNRKGPACGFGRPKAWLFFSKSELDCFEGRKVVFSFLGRSHVLNQQAISIDSVDEADQLRVNIYKLLARLLREPPDAPLLSILTQMTGDDSELGQAISDLSKAASETGLAASRDEYDVLFIGLGRGILTPFGSYYLTGFMHEKPLARLRDDMRPLGIARSDDVKDPEDHVAALMEMMAGLIEGSFGAAQSVTVQKSFFDRHVGSWTPHFFKDLEACPSARFFRPVGRIGRLFMAIEQGAFEM